MFAKKILAALLSGVFLASISPVIGSSVPVYASERLDSTSSSNLLKEDQQSLLSPNVVVSAAPSFDRMSRAVPLPNDPLILPLDTVFQPPIGSSTSIFENGKLLQLNPAQKSQQGAIWSKNKVSLLSDFTFKSYIYLGDSTDHSGDGMTFTLTNDDRMATQPTQVIGSPGMGIGAYSTARNKPYVRNALSIEFDTYMNRGSRDTMDTEIEEMGGIQGFGHVAFVTPSENNNKPSGEHSGVTVLQEVYLSNGTWRALTVHWDAASQTLSYKLDGVGEGSHQIPDLNEQFKGTDVYWGFTSSTGASFEENALAITQIPTNVTSEAQVSVNDGSFADNVEAKNGDKVTLKNILDLKGSFLSARNPKARIKLPAELAYTPNSITIDGKKVPDSAVTIEGTAITVPLDSYTSTEKTLEIQLDTTLTNAQPEQKLTLDFEYLEDDLKLQTSNEVTVNVVKEQEKTLHVYYKDAAGKIDLADPKIITGKIGTKYEEKPVSIPGYVFDHDSGNASGQFSLDSTDIYFYYRVGEFYFKEAPSDIDFGTHQISNQLISVFGQASGKLLIFDERGSSGWTLQLSQSEPLTVVGGTDQLSNVLSFVGDQGTLNLSEAAQNIMTSNQKGLSDETGLLDSKQKKGIRADIPVEDQRIGTFKGTLKWSLLNAPENN